MGRSRAALLVLLMLAGCAQPGPTPIAVPQSRPPSKVAVIPTDPAVVQKVANVLAGLDSQAYRGVSMAEVDGTVLLVGAVVRPDQRRVLEQRVAAVPGVNAVVNRILVIDAASLDSYRPDTAKERDLAGQLAVNLAVRVVHNVVYAVGVADPADIDQLKEIVAEDSSLQWVDASAVTTR